MKCLYSSFVFGVCGILSIVTNKKEETLGLINQDEHFYKVHLPIILGFITIILN